MKLLALDTSTQVCSVALSIDGKVIERFEREPRHGERLLAMIQELLAQAEIKLSQLDTIAFGRGPGSFTSLRIGAGVAQGLAFGTDLSVVPVSSLAVLAQGVDATNVLAAFDARMQQVYWGAFVRGADGLVTLIDREIVIDPAQAPLPAGRGWTGAGSGWDQYSELLRRRLDGRVAHVEKQSHPHAADVARLAVVIYERGEAVAPEQALPEYIRNDVAVKQSPRR